MYENTPLRRCSRAEIACKTTYAIASLKACIREGPHYNIGTQQCRIMSAVVEGLGVIFVPIR